MSVSSGRLRQFLAREFEGDLLLADGFDEALVGVAEGWFAGGRRQVALYDYEMCVRALMAEGLDETAAHEYMEFNVCGAYVGEGTPVFASFYRAPLLQPLED